MCVLELVPPRICDKPPEAGDGPSFLGKFLPLLARVVSGTRAPQAAMTIASPIVCMEAGVFWGRREAERSDR